MNYKYVIIYEDFKKKSEDTEKKKPEDLAKEDPREGDHIIANVNTGEYPKELGQNLDKLKEETLKLMDMRIKYLKINRNDIKEREEARSDLVHQFRKVTELENEFQRVMRYEERNYTETI